MTQWQRLSTIDPFTVHLRAGLLSGLLSGYWAGTMPGVHRLASEFGLNGKTVEAALQRLERAIAALQTKKPHSPWNGERGCDYG
jgi:hypothetical protein